ERERKQLVLEIALDLRLDGTLVESIALHQVGNAARGGGEILVVEGLAQRQARGIGKLSLVRRNPGLAAHFDGANKPLLGRVKPQRVSVPGRLPTHLDVLVFAGSVEAFDGLSNVVELEGAAWPEGNESFQIRTRYRLQRRFETDPLDRFAFVLARQ